MSDNNNQNTTKKSLHRGEKDVLAANLAYNITSHKTEDGTYLELPEGIINEEGIKIFQEAGVRFFGISDYLLTEEENTAKMRSVILLNEKTKEITISIAGTRVDRGLDKAYADLKDDLDLSQGNITSKQSAVERINEILIANLNQAAIDIKDYKFHYTGHSLGAVMADCAAADMSLRLQHKYSINVSKDQISTVTFDNPGATKLVKKICEQYQADYPNSNITVDELKKTTSFKAINNRPNFINTVDEQVGEKFTMVPHNQKPLNSFSLMCQYIGQRFCNTPILGYIVKVLSMGNPKDQIQDHYLENFQNVIVTQDKGVKGHFRGNDGRKMLLDEVITGMEPIKYDQQIFNKIQTIRKDENEKKVEAKYSMVTPDTQERIEFSKAQMEAAVGEMQKPGTLKTERHGWQETLNNEPKNIVTTLLQEAKVMLGKATGIALVDNIPPVESFMMRTAQEALGRASEKGIYTR